MDVRGKRVTLMGLGRHGGGVAAARWLARQGAMVTVTDLASAESLQASIAELQNEPIAAWRLGGHAEADFTQAEIVVVNPAVKHGHTLVQLAVANGARVTTELELFLERFPGRVIGVTGSNGKSTTAAMIAEILAADGRDARLGGNIGRSLLSDLSTTNEHSWAVIEISSFQLTWLSPACPMPQVSVLTNFSPNHLDWHADLADYAAAKRRMFANLPEHCAAVMRPQERIHPLWKSAATSAYIVSPKSIESLPALQLPGRHNQANAAAAAAAAELAGCSAAAIDRGLRRFSGLPHRLEFIATVGGMRFFNDSMATTPESVQAALDSFDRCWLLCGGYDKGIDMRPLVTSIAERAKGAAFYGAIGPRLLDLARQTGGRCALNGAEGLDDAFAWCVAHAAAGDVIALSPGCASYDQYVDYRERGARFRLLVRALEARDAR